MKNTENTENTETSGTTKSPKKEKRIKRIELTAEQKADKANSQVIKLLVGDEIAKIAELTEPILKTLSLGVGTMITEDLAANLGQIKDVFLKHLEKFEGKTPEDLARMWLDWQSIKLAAAAAAKEEALSEESNSKGGKVATNPKNESGTETSSTNSADNQETTETAEPQKAVILQKTGEAQSAARQSEGHSGSKLSEHSRTHREISDTAPSW